jgi:glutaredoxin 3
MTSQVTLFTKPNCKNCDRARKILEEAGINYQEIDVKANRRNADASIYLSYTRAIPQIFIGSYHVNDIHELEILKKSGRLIRLVKLNLGNLSVDKLSDKQLRQSAKDIVLREYSPLIQIFVLITSIVLVGVFGTTTNLISTNNEQIITKVSQINRSPNVV